MTYAFECFMFSVISGDQIWCLRRSFKQSTFILKIKSIYHLNNVILVTFKNYGEN